MTSSCDDGNSTLSKSVEEKIEREWVVCDSEKEEKSGYFEDAVKVSEDVVLGNSGAEFVSGYVIEDDPKSVGGVGGCYVFDETPERTEFKDEAVYVVKSDEGNVADPVLASDVGSSIQENCVKSIEAQQESYNSLDESYLFDESPQRTESKNDAVDPLKTDAGNAVDPVLASRTGSSIQEDCMNVQHESSAIDVKLEEREAILDDWQGIETTELEKKFGAAVAFLGSKPSSDRVNLIDNEVKMQFYGLHRVAIEGPCFESQPMALKVSARANWNAWKRLENLGREEAMERYIALLSQHVPDWMGNHVFEDDMQ
ncbi:hypothetical protein L1887_31465 [Cichorium endivia]|nr:hypothetical protein L1887_31465 [Cichorium endivia]